MPICPGCSRNVPYHALRRHVQLCKWLWSDTPERESRWNDQLAEQLGTLETDVEPDALAAIERRLAGIEERLAQLEANEE